MTPPPGIQFQELWIKNGRVFKNERFPLADQGVVSILGENGVGKSTIWNLLEALIFGSTPSGHKKDELVKDDEDASIGVSFIKDEIFQIALFSRTKGKWGYKCLAVVNKGKPECDHRFKFDNKEATVRCTRVKDCDFFAKDETAHGYNESAKQIRALLGWSQEEFEGSIHLTQNAAHILISGKPAERKKYISDFFGLDDRYDQVLKAAKFELSKVEDDIERISSLVHSKQVLDDEIKSYSYQDLAPSEEELRNSSSSILTSQQSILQTQSLIDQANKYHALLPIAQKHTNPEEQATQIEGDVIQWQAQLQNAEAIKRQNSRARSQNQTIDQLEAEATNIKSAHPQVESQPDNLPQRQASLIQVQRQYQATQTYRTELAGLSKISEVSTADMEQEQVNLLTSSNELSGKLKAVRDGRCSQCGANYTSQDLQTLQQEYDVVRETLDALKSDLGLIRERNKKAQRRSTLEQMLISVEEFTPEMEQELVSINNILPALQRFLLIKNQLSSLSRIEILEELNVGDLDSKIASSRFLLQDLKSTIQAKKDLPGAPSQTVEELNSVLEQWKNALSDQESRKSSLQIQIGQIQNQNERYNRIKRQIDTIDSDLNTLPELKQLEYFWSKVVDAYGPRGLRVQQLKKIMDAVLERLPYYTAMLFQEKGLRFTHDVDADNVTILAHRSELRKAEDEEGNPTETFHEFFHDVSSFSGGEQKRLSVCFVLTLADCVSQNKKANVLILDEIDANLDTTGQYLFVNELLPLLKESYSSIFVTSHAQEVKQAAVYNQAWVLKKQNHWTELERVQL